MARNLSRRNVLLGTLISVSSTALIGQGVASASPVRSPQAVDLLSGLRAGLTVSIGVDAGQVGTIHAGRPSTAKKRAGADSSKGALHYNWAEREDAGGDHAAMSSPTDPHAYSNANGTGLYPGGSSPQDEELSSLGLWLSHARAPGTVKARLLPGAEFVSEFLLKADSPSSRGDIFPAVLDADRWQKRFKMPGRAKAASPGTFEFSEPETHRSESGLTAFRGLVRFTTDQPVSLDGSATHVDFLPNVTWKSETYLSLNVSSVLQSGVIEVRQGEAVERLDIGHDSITDVRLTR